jgi:uncharacterized protein (TIGR00290 family)
MTALPVRYFEDGFMDKCGKKAAVMWTGGKDSALAFEEASTLGYCIDRLVTFVPCEADFKAHSLSVLPLQAEAAGLPLDFLKVEEPYFNSYRLHIQRLKDEFGIDAVVTGDIDLVDGYPSWVRQCAEGTGVDVLTPLWNIRRGDAMERLINRGYKVILSLVKYPWMDASWVGRELSRDSVAELGKLVAERGLDLCGENGEYHSLVLDAPFYRKQLVIDGFTVDHDGEMAWLRPGCVHLTAK